MSAHYVSTLAFVQDRLAAAGAKWSVKIPASIAPGEYILRHEILGLHVAATLGGAQFVSLLIYKCEGLSLLQPTPGVMMIKI